MVAKCSNPDCNCEFQELSKGRLFLLPPSHHVPRLIDHCYWLCPSCARTYTLRLDGSRVVVEKIERLARFAATG